MPGKNYLSLIAPMIFPKIHLLEALKGAAILLRRNGWHSHVKLLQYDYKVSKHSCRSLLRCNAILPGPKGSYWLCPEAPFCGLATTVILYYNRFHTAFSTSACEGAPFGQIFDVSWTTDTCIHLASFIDILALNPSLETLKHNMSHINAYGVFGRVAVSCYIRFVTSV